MNELQQEEWKKRKNGWVGASRINDVCAKIKTGEAKTRADYKVELVAARITGKYPESYTSAEMTWGIETESQAKAAFSFITDIQIEDVGFIPHPSIDMAGASPDGLTSDGGLIETKCPKTKTHIGYLLSGGCPSEYFNQVQWQMACTGRQFCHFVSYDPRLEGLELFNVRVERDQNHIDKLEAEVVKFLAEVDELERKLRSKMV